MLCYAYAMLGYAYSMLMLCYALANAPALVSPLSLPLCLRVCVWAADFFTEVFIVFNDFCEFSRFGLIFVIFC